MWVNLIQFTLYVLVYAYIMHIGSGSRWFIIAHVILHLPQGSQRKGIKLQAARVPAIKVLYRFALHNFHISPHYLHVSSGIFVSFRDWLCLCDSLCMFFSITSTYFVVLRGLNTSKWNMQYVFFCIEGLSPAPVLTGRTTGQIPMPPQYVTLAAQGLEQFKFDSKGSW